MNEDLYQIIEAEDIGLMEAAIPLTVSASSRINGKYHIILDANATNCSSDERTHLLHELGHCATGSFHDPRAKLDIRAKHERRADVWAFKHELPPDKLRRLFRRGITESWELAEELGLSQQFIEKAMEYYRNVRPLGA